MDTVQAKSVSHCLSVNIRWSQIWRKTNRLWRVIIRSWPMMWRVCSKSSLNLSTRERNLRLSCKSSWPASARERRLKESFQIDHTNYRSVLLDCVTTSECCYSSYQNHLLHLVPWNTVTLPPPSHYRWLLFHWFLQTESVAVIIKLKPIMFTNQSNLVSYETCNHFICIIVIIRFGPGCQTKCESNLK